MRLPIAPSPMKPTVVIPPSSPSAPARDLLFAITTARGSRKMIPPGLEWLRASEAGRAWLRAVPALVEDCVERWSLVVGPPFPYAFASPAIPA